MERHGSLHCHRAAMKVFRFLRAVQGVSAVAVPVRRGETLPKEHRLDAGEAHVWGLGPAASTEAGGRSLLCAQNLVLCDT